jgi:hypothetical protein
MFVKRFPIKILFPVFHCKKIEIVFFYETVGIHQMGWILTAPD